MLPLGAGISRLLVLGWTLFGPPHPRGWSHLGSSVRSFWLTLRPVFRAVCLVCSLALTSGG